MYLFIQFQSMNGKEKFLKATKVSACRRFWLRCCRKKDKLNAIKHIYFEGKWPKILTETPDPSLIQWQNLGVGKCSRFLRAILIYSISILIMAACFYLIMLAYAQKSTGK